MHASTKTRNIVVTFTQINKGKEKRKT